MKSLKKYFTKYIITSLEILLLTFIITAFYYYDIIPNYIFSFLLLLIILLCLFFNSFILGKESKEKGYFEGIKLGSLFTITFLLIVLITHKFTWKLLIYYFIIITTSILGSILGINKKA